MMTTNDTLPKAIREQYELTKDLKGGPIFDFPRLGGLRINFLAITERQCESLINRGWPHLRRKTANSPAPAPVQETAADPVPVSTEPEETPAPEPEALPAPTRGRRT